MSDDLIERLRHGDGCAGEHVPGSAARYEDTLAEAADEIERLRLRLNEYENLYGPPWWVDDEDGA